MSNLKSKPIFCLKKNLKVTADVTGDQLVTFGYVMGRLTSPTSIEIISQSQKPVNIHSACVIFNNMIIYVNIMTFELQTSIKRP